MLPQLWSSRDEKCGAVVVAEGKSIGEHAQGFRARGAAQTAFQITDRAGADTRAFGQLLLAQSGGQPKAPNQGSKLCCLNGRHGPTRVGYARDARDSSQS